MVKLIRTIKQYFDRQRDIGEKLDRLTEKLDELAIGQQENTRLLVNTLEKTGIMENDLKQVIEKQTINDQMTFENQQNLIRLIKVVAENIDSQKAYSELNKKNNEEIITNVNSIFSYCQNEMIKSKVQNTEIYLYYKELHELLKMYSIKDVTFERVGKAHDGGYVMVKPYSDDLIAYSLGICDDVSWDSDMSQYGYEIYQYDHTISALPEENEKFHWKKIGLTGLEETAELKHLETLIRDNGHSSQHGMVLKMDIEGYEWDLLANLKENTLNQFDQIVMELHGLNNLKNTSKTLSALRNITKTHNVVHIHGNNYRYISACGEYVTPDALEVTMVKKKSFFEFEEKEPKMMTLMDEVNREGSQDIWLNEW